MVRTALLLALVIAAPAAASEPLPGPIPAEVVRVIDADTIAVTARIWPGHTVATRVRLAGVDAPEISRPGCDAERAAGEAATGFVRERLAPGSPVTLAAVEQGSFAGRVVARLSDAEGRDLSEALLAAGHAVAYGEDGHWCGAAVERSR
ncbi:nuclease [Marinicauda salina]|uniref:Nuclease n=1 Tax=Marinicauda salina TaxID=2135793 RepID=A0A2U2BVY2_9PROT|nr:thermonuclease family protein [Marinicauda salina]PWE18181.1 nuclease [Marinicauda salina]